MAALVSLDLAEANFYSGRFQEIKGGELVHAREARHLPPVLLAPLGQLGLRSFDLLDELATNHRLKRSGA